MDQRVSAVYTEDSSASTLCGHKSSFCSFNPLNAELNPIRHLLALVGARHIVHVSRIRVKQALLVTVTEKRVKVALRDARCELD